MIFPANAEPLPFLAISKNSGERTNNYSANRSILYKFIGFIFYLLRLLQNIELGLQFCTGTVSEQPFSEQLNSLSIEGLLLTQKVPSSNPGTGGMWEGERSFIVCVL